MLKAPAVLHEQPEVKAGKENNFIIEDMCRWRLECACVKETSKLFTEMLAIDWLRRLIFSSFLVTNSALARET